MCMLETGGDSSSPRHRTSDLLVVAACRTHPHSCDSHNALMLEASIYEECSVCNHELSNRMQ